MAFQTYDPGPNARRFDDPRLSIYSDGSARANAVAMAEHFDDTETVAVKFDRDAGLLGFDADPDPDEHTLTLSQSEGQGADISLAPALRELGVDTDAIEETHYLSMDKGPSGLVVCNLSELPGVDVDLDAVMEKSEPVEESSTDDGSDEQDDEEWPDAPGGIEPPLDHTNRMELQLAYDEADTISEAADWFEPQYQTIYQALRDAGIHEPGDETTQTVADEADEEETITVQYPEHPPDLPAGTRERHLSEMARMHDRLSAVAADLGVGENRAAIHLVDHGLEDEVDFGPYEVVE